MRYNILTFVLVMIFSLDLSAQDGNKALKFDFSEVNLGVISLKETTYSPFYFTNNSTKPQVIVEAKTSCGCTKATYNRRPILAGKRDSVMVRFKPDELGAFYKKVIIKNSDGSSNVLIVKGSVK